MTDPRDQPPPRPRARRVDVSAELRQQADDALRRQATQGRPDKPKPRNVTVNVIRPPTDAPRTTTPPPEPDPPDPGTPSADIARLHLIAARLRRHGLHPDVTRRHGLTLPGAELDRGRELLAGMEDAP